MNENAKKWVGALRSGEYEQAKHTLQFGGAFCCLGVACQVYEKETGKRLPRKNGAGAYNRAALTHGFRKVQRWLGLSSSVGRFAGSTLALKNDEGFFDFKAIADLIEAEPEGLFVEGEA